MSNKFLSTSRHTSIYLLKEASNSLFYRLPFQYSYSYIIDALLRTQHWKIVYTVLYYTEEKELKVV